VASGGWRVGYEEREISPRKKTLGEEAVSTMQADAFAGANAEEGSRPALLGMTVVWILLYQETAANRIPRRNPRTLPGQML
jgi:hypothetical protein